MAIEYCNTTSDLVRVYRAIQEYKGLETLTGWENTSGAVYKIDQSGYVAMVFDDGVEMTASSPATTTPAAGEFSYIESSDILYVRISDDSDPASSTMHNGPDWSVLTSAARNDAQEMLEGLLKSVYAVPFQKILTPGTSYNSRDYDYWINRATALLTCYIIISQVNPDDPTAIKMLKQVDNPEPLEVEDKPGIIQRILNGEIVLRTQKSAREIGGFNAYEGASNNAAGYLKLSGRYTGSQKEVWTLTIDTSGTPGTATWKLSRDNGGTFDFTLQETRNSNSDNRRVDLTSNIEAEFVGTFSLNDTWDIELFPHTDRQEVQQFTAIRMAR